MRNGPVPFSDIGKRARELLYKDYNFDQKFSFSIGDSEKGITASCVKTGQEFVGDISTQHKNDRNTVDVKIDSNSNITTTYTFNEVVAGLNTSCTLRLPDQKSGKLSLQYLHDRVALNSSVGLTSTPLLELAASVGTKEFSVGAEVGFDSASASFSKYNCGIGYSKHDFSAALELTGKEETLKASYLQVIFPESGTAVAAEALHRFKSNDNNFTIGSCHAVDSSTLLKTKLSSTGRVALLWQREWRHKSQATVSVEYDPGAVTPSRVGFGLALKP